MQNIHFTQYTYPYNHYDFTGWPEAFPIPDKSADTIVSTFINYYLPVLMHPQYILLDSGT